MTSFLVSHDVLMETEGKKKESKEKNKVCKKGEEMVEFKKMSLGWLQ